MKSIEAIAQFKEDGTVVLELNSPVTLQGTHKVILVVDETDYSIPVYKRRKNILKKRNAILLNSPIWNDEQYETWIKEKENLYSWFQ